MHSRNLSQSCAAAGAYQAPADELRNRTGPDADQPHRVTYKQLVRA
jgi:hypothetical protein